MSKASHLVYTLHPKTLTNPLLAYNLTKPLTLTRLMKKFDPSPIHLVFSYLKILQVFFKNRGNFSLEKKFLNFLSFLVFLYISGNFKENFF